MKEHPMMLPLTAFVVTVIALQAPWTGLLLTIPFVMVTSNNTKGF